MHGIKDENKYTQVIDEIQVAEEEKQAMLAELNNKDTDILVEHEEGE